LQTQPNRPFRVPRLLLLVLLLVMGSLPLAAWANHDGNECHPNQPGCTPGGELYLPFSKPNKELDYILAKRAHLWKTAWRHHYEYKPWDVETYDPAYVNPSSFKAFFEQQCQNKTDWDYFVNNIGAASQVGRYQYSVNGVVQVVEADCSSQEVYLPGQGIHDVKLEVFAPGASTPYLTKQEDVRVRDYLIVLLGDSAASGEGSPEFNRLSYATWGDWVDARCHRSSKAGVPLAVEALEDADPHSTVTFLNFACSGATIKLWEKDEGSGILGKYRGIEPTPEAEEDGEYYFLPSQVDQLSTALRTPYVNGVTATPTRPVEMLFTTGGINDVRIAKLAVACLIEDNCDSQASAFYDAENNWVGYEFDRLAANIPQAYEDLGDALADDEIQIAPRDVYVMQYPGAYQKDNGQLCTSMLDDVLPASSVWGLVLNPLLWGPLTTGTLFSPIINLGLNLSVTDILYKGLQGDLAWTSEEIEWMVDHAMPKLDQVVRDGADNAGFNFVDGIQAKFDKHGYCANTNYIQRGNQSSFVQGPWNWMSKPFNVPGDPLYNPLSDLGFNIHAATKGLMHPNVSGYLAIADVLAPILADLINLAPVAKPDSYQVNTSITPAKLVTGPFEGVLVNDIEPNGDPVRALMVKGPTNGTATLDYDGNLVYIPNPGFSGFDSVYYKVTDGALTSNMTKVTLSVKSPRDPGGSWKWTFPTGEATPVVQIGGTAEFPICNKCQDMVLRVNPEQQPGFGRVTLEKKNDQWRGTFFQNGLLPPRLPWDDRISVEIGRIVLGAFKKEGGAEITVRIEGEPQPTWSWIFRTPEVVARNATTRFDLCDSCGDLQVRATVLPQLGSVSVELDAPRNRWVATYAHNPLIDSPSTSDGFGVEIGRLEGSDIFTVIDSTRVALDIQLQ